jgi:hypothetical protein
MILLSLSFSFMPAFGQEVISVNDTMPCFLNATATYHIFEDCNANGDFLDFALIGWEWVTGGFFSMILVSVIIVAVWKKYNEVIYPIFIGIVFLPFAWFFFPAVFLSWAIIMAFVGIGILIWYVLIRQTQ